MPKHKFSESDVKFIYNTLRKATTVWSGRKEVLDRARKNIRVGNYKNGKPKYKLHWRCAKCEGLFRDVESLEVDHITEIGGVTSFNGDWNEMIKKIMPRPVEKFLQCLCIPCHLKKTGNYCSAASKFVRKKK